jgi:threonine dehydrogenase-like Zn-dependent dehydrogenase
MQVTRRRPRRFACPNIVTPRWPAHWAPSSVEYDMRALCWHGKKDVRVDNVPDPVIEHPRDAIVKVSSCAICGSDLHLFDGFMPSMKSGDILGHEFMGEVVEVGPGLNFRR